MFNDNDAQQQASIHGEGCDAVLKPTSESSTTTRWRPALHWPLIFPAAELQLVSTCGARWVDRWSSEPPLCEGCCEAADDDWPSVLAGTGHIKAIGLGRLGFNADELEREASDRGFSGAISRGTGTRDTGRWVRGVLDEYVEISASLFEHEEVVKSVAIEEVVHGIILVRRMVITHEDLAEAIEAACGRLGSPHAFDDNRGCHIPSSRALLSAPEKPWGLPHGTFLYDCLCGSSWTASVSTTVTCPGCGEGSGWEEISSEESGVAAWRCLDEPVPERGLHNLLLDLGFSSSSLWDGRWAMPGSFYAELEVDARMSCGDGLVTAVIARYSDGQKVFWERDVRSLSELEDALHPFLVRLKDGQS